MSKGRQTQEWANKRVHVAVEGANFFHFLREKIKDDAVFGSYT